MNINMRRSDFFALYANVLFKEAASVIIDKAIGQIAIANNFDTKDYECEPLRKDLKTLISRLRSKWKKCKKSKTVFEKKESLWLHARVFNMPVRRKATGKLNTQICYVYILK